MRGFARAPGGVGVISGHSMTSVTPSPVPPSSRVGARRAVLFAGAGIVEGSTPDGEHAETGTKLSTFLAALGLDARARPAR